MSTSKLIELDIHPASAPSSREFEDGVVAEAFVNPSILAIYGTIDRKRMFPLLPPTGGTKLGWNCAYHNSYGAKVMLDGDVVGGAYLLPIKGSLGQGFNISYVLNEDAEGRGLATLMCSHLMAFALRSTQGTKDEVAWLNLQTAASNERSCLLAARLGFDLDPNGYRMLADDLYATFLGDPEVVLQVCEHNLLQDYQSKNFHHEQPRPPAK